MKASRQRRFEMPSGPQSTAVKDGSSAEPLFVAIQGGFVDEPRKAVQDADGLVAAAIKRLAEVFAEERSKLEHECPPATPWPGPNRPRGARGPLLSVTT